MEIDITDFVRNADPAEYSASVAERGISAGRETWSNALGDRPPMLTTAAHLDALRAWARDSGGWERAEIAAWDDEECNALFVQIISGDLRTLESLASDDDGEVDWEEAGLLAEEGTLGGCIYRGDVPNSPSFGRIFYYLGS